MKHKIKHFIWRCLQEILPVNTVINGRCSEGNHICKCCGESPETIEHMLFFCSNAKSIWKAASLSWKGLEIYKNNFGIDGKN